MTRYGQQERAARGYNPRLRGRYSHHPLMVFIADVHMVANQWLRPSNSHRANNALPCLNDSLDKLGGKRVALLHFRVHHGDNEFAHSERHINDIESFLSFAKRRLAKFNSVPEHTFYLYLEKTEFRFNHRHDNLSMKFLNCYV